MYVLLKVKKGCTCLKKITLNFIRQKNCSGYVMNVVLNFNMIFLLYL